MNVILSSNVSHYSYTALALQRENYLRRYICSIQFQKFPPIVTRLLSQKWRSKIMGRTIPDINPHLIRNIWVGEFFQRILPALGLVSRDRGDWINNNLYDFLARLWVNDCDIFHFVSSVGLYSARKAKAKGSIIICDIRTEYPDYQYKILEEESRRLGLTYNPPGLLYDKKIKGEFSLADYFIVPSHYAKRTFVEAGFDPDVIFVLPYGVDLSIFYSSNHEFVSTLPEQKSGDPFRIVYAGQITLRKGLHYLIEAFEKIKDENVELVLIGKVDESMTNVVEKTLNNPKIRITGTIPKIELSQLYQTGSVFILPSLADSWGLVVLEAMACGLPVITTENTGSSEVIIDGQNGFVVPIRNPDALKEKITYLMEHPQIRQEMALNAQNSIHECSWENYGNRLISIYQTIWDREKANKDTS
jgi:glycosyltransferase involved in cell wall biosynthesis